MAIETVVFEESNTKRDANNVASDSEEQIEAYRGQLLNLLEE